MLFRSQINLCISTNIAGSTSTYTSGAIYKNGTIFKGNMFYGISGSPMSVAVCCVIYMNGSTDYLEGYICLSGNTGGYSGSTNSTGSIGAGGAQTLFSGSLIRSA